MIEEYGFLIGVFFSICYFFLGIYSSRFFKSDINKEDRYIAFDMWWSFYSDFYGDVGKRCCFVGKFIFFF